MEHSDEEWKTLLTPDQFAVLRERATEAPYSGELLYNDEDGTYSCAACGTQLFASQHKFEAGCGWPSFYNVIGNQAVILKEDRTQGMQRIEVLCKNCGGHLGHVFNDAPDQPTGMRFCINSVALNFKSEPLVKE